MSVNLLHVIPYKIVFPKIFRKRPDNRAGFAVEALVPAPATNQSGTARPAVMIEIDLCRSRSTLLQLLTVASPIQDYSHVYLSFLFTQSGTQWVVTETINTMTDFIQPQIAASVRFTSTAVPDFDQIKTYSVFERVRLFQVFAHSTILSYLPTIPWENCRHCTDFSAASRST